MAPILTIDTLVARSDIKIDGALYGIRNNDELSVLSGGRLRHLTQRINALELASGEDTTDDDKTEYETLTAEVCSIVLDAPAEVIAKLKSGNKVAIIKAFIQLRQNGATTPGAQTGRAKQSPKRTGAKSSRS